MSPSARKVLIEILLQSCLLLPGSVTFCKEGVDWNVEMGYDVPKILVTFHKEGVDWNFSGHETKTSGNVTFRKEGVDWNNQINRYQRESFVTFRKEGVDWNYATEMNSGTGVVTFRKEGVDWNCSLMPPYARSSCHLPQGRCGLKCLRSANRGNACSHLPQGRCGLKLESKVNEYFEYCVTFCKWIQFHRFDKEAPPPFRGDFAM